VQLPITDFTPAVGQGSVAIECCSDLTLDKKAAIRKAVTHQVTEYRLLCERAFLRKLQGGCSIPVFGLATIDGNQITIHGGIVSLDGQQIIRKTMTGTLENVEKIGTQLAEDVLLAGGDEILETIKKELGQ
jgi:hydroxymethylbilane synthase